MRRLLASDLLPQRAGQPVKALVHIYFAELAERDAGSALQDKWIAAYRAQWAAHRAAASVTAGDGGAWLEGDTARAIACDAIIIPVVTADIDPAAVEELIGLCVCYHRTRAGASAGQAAPDGQAGPGPQDLAGAGNGTVISAWPGGTAATVADQAVAAARAAQDGDAAAARAAEVLAMLEHQILAKILQVVSGPGGAASFLRRNLLGQGLNGPSLPLDVGQTDDIPVHLRRLADLRDQTCQFPGGYFL
jgi:hypothetical protein